MKLSNVIPRRLNRRIPYKGSVHKNPSKDFAWFTGKIRNITEKLEEAVMFAEGGDYGACQSSMDYAQFNQNSFIFVGRHVLPSHYGDILDAQEENFVLEYNEIMKKIKGGKAA